MQKQYLNTRLQKNHIDKILSNYNIKYTTMRNEIDNKINLMIKTFNLDISSFLSKFVEIAEQKQKLKAFEHNQCELASIREQLKDKIHEVTRLKREIELLKIENNKLKNECYNHASCHSTKNQTFSPSTWHRNFQLNSASFNRTQKILKDEKNSLLKTETKDKEKRVKSPIYISRSKTSKKLTEYDLEDKIRIKKKSNSKILNSNKNNLSNPLYSEVKTEQSSSKNIKNLKGAIKKKNNKIVVIKKKDFNKNEDSNKNLNSKKNKPKISTNDTRSKLSNSTRNSLNINIKNKKKKLQTMNLPKTTKNENENENELKKCDDNSFSKESEYSSEDNENESNVNSEIKDDKKIDTEINEMNDIEDDILSIMDQINVFANQHNNGSQ